MKIIDLIEILNIYNKYDKYANIETANDEIFLPEYPLAITVEDKSVLEVFGVFYSDEYGSYMIFT